MGMGVIILDFDLLDVNIWFSRMNRRNDHILTNADFSNPFR